MKLLITLISCLFVFSISAQDEETIYYEDKLQKIETSDESKAKSKTIKSISNGVLSEKTYIIKRKNDVLKSIRYYKDEQPFGKWETYKNGTLIESLDYGTELVYSDSKVESAYYFKIGKQLTTEVEGMEVPKIIGFDDIYSGLYGTLRYPAYARVNGVQGEVVINIKITKEGALENIAIVESSHPSLNKAAWDALAQCKIWKPSTLNGEPIESYALVPVKFKLEG